MKKPDIIRLAVLILVLLIAAAYPLKTIYEFEYPEIPPVEFRFRCTGFDPYDAFRGRYVRVQPLPNEIIARKNEKFKWGESVYVLLETKNGYAVVTGLSAKKPEKGNFIRVKYSYCSAKWTKGKKSKEQYHHFNYPFGYYYINEKSASSAEKAVQKAVRKNRKSCVLSVLIYSNGSFAVKDLLIDGKPLKEVLKKN